MAMLETPRQLGAWVRRRRRALDLKQDELAVLVEVGARFVRELEAGKPTCQIGKVLAVVRALGGRLADAAGAEGLRSAAPAATVPMDSSTTGR
jgi:y4mF family transcriptional regulator